MCAAEQFAASDRLILRLRLQAALEAGVLRVAAALAEFVWRWRRRRPDLFNGYTSKELDFMADMYLILLFARKQEVEFICKVSLVLSPPTPRKTHCRDRWEYRRRACNDQCLSHRLEGGDVSREPRRERGDIFPRCALIRGMHETSYVDWRDVRVTWQLTPLFLWGSLVVSRPNLVAFFFVSCVGITNTHDNGGRRTWLGRFNRIASVNS